MKWRRGRGDRMGRKRSRRRREFQAKRVNDEDRVNGQSKVRDEVEGNRRQQRRVRQEEMRQKKTVMMKEDGQMVAEIMPATCVEWFHLKMLSFNISDRLYQTERGIIFSFLYFSNSCWMNEC